MPFNSLILVLPILALLIYGLGLELRITDFMSFKPHPNALFIGLFAQLILLPIIALVLIHLFQVPYPFAVGILLLALSPGGSSSNAFTLLANGNVALSVALTALTSIINLVTLPLVLMFYLNETTMMQLPIWKLFIQNIILVLLPLLLGMLTLRFKPLFAAKASAIVRKYGMWPLFILVVIFFIDNNNLIIHHFTSLAAILLLMLLATTLLGTAIGKAFRLNSPDKRTIFIEIGMQNAAQAIAIASSPFLFNNQQMAIPAIIYAFLMNIVLLLYLAVLKYNDKRTLS